MTPKTAAYLDYQASTPLDPRVREVMFEAFASHGNASSEEHAFGWAQAGRLTEAREAVAALIGAEADEVTFTAGATEANNLGVLGAALGAPGYRRRILISSIEHKSVSEAAYAAQRQGFSIEVLPVGKNGVVEIERLAAALDETVAVVSVMAVNNEIGTVQPVAEIGALVRAVGAFFHVDATQAPIAIDIDVGLWAADSLSLSAHKLYGPCGVGALHVAMDAPWRPRPLMFGGGHEGGLRPGTPATALCVGFGEACRILQRDGAMERVKLLGIRQDLRDSLAAAAPELVVTCADSPRHPGNLHVRIPGRSASDLLLRLQPAVAASTGSACTSGVIGPSHVALAIGLSRVEAAECLRFSVGRFTTDADIALAGEALRAVCLKAAA